MYLSVNGVYYILCILFSVQYNSTGICTVCILSQFLYSSNSTVYEYEMV